MLVLTRKLGEDVVINNEITVTIVAIEGGRVRVGITAPRDVPVDRGEVHRRKSTSKIPHSTCPSRLRFPTS